MANETKPEGGAGNRERPRGLAIGKLLLPAGVVAGAIVGPYVMRTAAGLSTVPAWLVGGPLGAVVGMLAAFVVLVVLNAVVRMAGKR